MNCNFLTIRSKFHSIRSSIYRKIFSSKIDIPKSDGISFPCFETRTLWKTKRIHAKFHNRSSLSSRAERIDIYNAARVALKERFR